MNAERLHRFLTPQSPVKVDRRRRRRRRHAVPITLRAAAAGRMTSAQWHTAHHLSYNHYQWLYRPTLLICADHLILRDADRFLEDSPNDALVARRSCQTSVVSEILFLVAWKQIFQRKLRDRVHVLLYNIIIIIIAIISYHQHRRRNSVNLGVGHFCPKIMHEMPEFHVIFTRKIIKMPEFLWYLPENKINKISEFYMPGKIPNCTW